MATRSRIGLLQGDTVKSIYCHWDGYPDFVGRILVEFYESTERIEALLSLGNLSSIAPRIQPEGEHSFDKPEKDTCVFYMRDRGTENEHSIDLPLQDYLDFVDNDWTEYHYLFQNGEWFYVHYTDKNKPDELKKVTKNFSVLA